MVELLTKEGLYLAERREDWRESAFAATGFASNWFWGGFSMDTMPYIRKANYYETDQMGIIHHSNYIRWFEEARIDFMEKIGFGYGKAVNAGIDFAVLSVTCDYKSMVRFGDTVKIYTNITYMTEMKLTIAYKVIDAKSGELRAIGETRHCPYHNERERPVSLKKALPELYEMMLNLTR